MSIFSLILIGISLSMDAVCVSVSNGMRNSKPHNHSGKLRQGLLIAATFGIFQGIMPIIGYYAGFLVSDFFTKYSNLTVSVIFFFLGGKMIKDALSPEEESDAGITFTSLLIQAVATSIDALAVGLGFCILEIPIFSSSLTIAGITFLMCLIAFFLGKKAGEVLENKAGIIGGILLLLIACKSLFGV